MRKFLLLGSLLLVSCVVTVRHIEITPIEPGEDAESPILVESPVKAHLVDGSTVVFPKGLRVDEDMVRGEGFKYDITLENTTPVTEIELDDVAAMESYQDVVNTGGDCRCVHGNNRWRWYGRVGITESGFRFLPDNLFTREW